MITKAYRGANRQLHERAGYGSSGHLWLGHIVELADAIKATSLLDYGAGKATLGKYAPRFGLSYFPYDPATFPKRPKAPSDMTVCLDVLEHIEPDYLEDVLDDIANLTTLLAFFVVSTRASSKTLSDGRNAHLIQEGWPWWKNRLVKSRKFIPLRVRQHEDHFEFVGAPRGITTPNMQKLRTLQ